jgi:hypothetical protein
VAAAFTVQQSRPTNQSSELHTARCKAGGDEAAAADNKVLNRGKRGSSMWKRKHR